MMWYTELRACTCPRSQPGVAQHMVDTGRLEVQGQLTTANLVRQVRTVMTSVTPEVGCHTQTHVTPELLVCAFCI